MRRKLGRVQKRRHPRAPGSAEKAPDRRSFRYIGVAREWFHRYRHACLLMNEIALVMIVRDEARSIERCLLERRAVGRRDGRARHRLARRDAGDRPPARRARRRLRMERRFRGGAQRRARADRGAAGAWSSTPTSGSPTAPTARRARGREPIHRRAQRRQPVRRGDAAASARRRAGCRACCRAASLRGPDPRAARLGAAAPAPAARRRPRRLPRRPRRQKAGRNVRLLAARPRRRSPTTPICTTSSARTSRCARAFDGALPHYARAAGGPSRRGLAPRPGRAERSSR